MNDGFEIVEDGTLQEAIASDRRLTTRNIVRWVDQLIGNVLNSGKAFLSVGDFGVVDVKLGYASSLGSSIAYNEAFIAWLKLGRAIHVDKFEPTAPSNDKKLSSDNDRIAVLDFQRRVAAVQKELSVSQTKKDGTRPPRGFECVKMLRFESRHDNNIVIPYVTDAASIYKHTTNVPFSLLLMHISGRTTASTRCWWAPTRTTPAACAWTCAVWAWSSCRSTPSVYSLRMSARS
jgi:hypothetical protein